MYRTGRQGRQLVHQFRALARMCVCLLCMYTILTVPPVHTHHALTPTLPSLPSTLTFKHADNTIYMLHELESDKKSRSGTDTYKYSAI